MKQYKIDMYKNAYPPGTQIELVSMEDPDAVPPGTKGTVDFVDAVGTIHVTWENGRTLGVCPDVDRVRKVEPPAQASVRNKLKDAAAEVEPAGIKTAATPKREDR